MTYAGFWRRVGAYLIDVLPITLFTTAVFYFAFGFDETLRRHLNAPRNLDHRSDFLAQRNQIRDLSFLLYMFYCAIMESSSRQATFGKQWLNIRVVSKDGQPVSIAAACGRNLAKLISYIPLGLGFLWVGWSSKKRGWHDMLAGTLVVYGDAATEPVTENEPLVLPDDRHDAEHH